MQKKFTLNQPLKFLILITSLFLTEKTFSQETITTDVATVNYAGCRPNASQFKIKLTGRNLLPNSGNAAAISVTTFGSIRVINSSGFQSTSRTYNASLGNVDTDVFFDCDYMASLGPVGGTIVFTTTNGVTKSIPVGGAVGHTPDFSNLSAPQINSSSTNLLVMYSVVGNPLGLNYSIQNAGQTISNGTISSAPLRAVVPPIKPGTYPAVCTISEPNAPFCSAPNNFTINVIQGPENSNLNSLDCIDGPLSPVFSPSQTNYILNISKSKTRFSASTADGSATMELNGSPLVNNQNSSIQTLVPGPNLFTVKVKTVFSTAKDYKITVFPPTISNNYLNDLHLLSGTLSPEFYSGTYDYSVTLPENVPFLRVYATPNDPSATILVNNNPPANPVTIYFGFTTTVNVKVTATDGIARTYVIHATKAPGKKLATLSLSSGSFSIPFDPSQNNYTCTVPASVSNETITAMTYDPAATITVNNNPVSSPVALVDGPNVLNVKVTATDGTTNIYTITVNRISADASLSNLTTSSGLLSPYFSPTTFTYNTSVKSTDQTIILTPTTTSSNATYLINGASQSNINLNYGSNTIYIKVTAEDGVTTNTYTLNVYRPAITDADLSALNVDIGILTPSFLKSVTVYSDTVANIQTAIKISFTPEDLAALVSVNNQAATSGIFNAPINVRDNIFLIKVTAADGISTKTYKLNIYRRPSSNAKLANLSFNGLTLSPNFINTTNNYTLSVPNTLKSGTVNASSGSAGQTITYNGNVSNNINLNVGVNNIAVKVIAQDGVTANTYNIAITRDGATEAHLNALTFSFGSIKETFSPTVFNYTASVANSVSTITLTSPTSDPEATVLINGQSLSTPIDLAVGDNIITIKVIASDGLTTNTYKLTITRAASTNADLSSLSLTSGTLTPALNPTFTANNLNYTLTVPSTVTSIMVNAGKADPNSTVTVNGVDPTLPVSLHPGINNINIVVKAQDGIATITYVVNVNVAATLPSNTNLSNLTLSTGQLLLPFSNSSTTFDVFLGNVVSSLTITPVPEDPLAKVTVNGLTPATSFPISFGDNRFLIEVTAQNGTKKTYALSAPKLADTHLTGFTPTSAGPGDIVTITGLNFTGATKVTFGGKDAGSFVVVNDNQINAEVGVGSSGAVEVTSPTGKDNYLGFTYLSPLPITFVSLTSKQLPSAVDLEWKVADGFDTKQYFVERSDDGINFKTIAIISTTLATNYSYKDANPLNGTGYYRIKAVSLSTGKTVYSSIIKNTGSTSEQTISVYPNPVAGKTFNVLTTGIKGTATISIYNHAGVLILKKIVQLVNNKNTIPIELPKVVPSGLYSISLTENGQKARACQFIITK